MRRSATRLSSEGDSELSAGEGPPCGGSELIEELLQRVACPGRVRSRMLRRDRDCCPEALLRELDRDSRVRGHGCGLAVADPPGDDALRVAVGDLHGNRLRGADQA